MLQVRRSTLTILCAPLTIIVLCLSLSCRNGSGRDDADSGPVQPSAARVAGPLKVTLRLNRETYPLSASLPLTVSVANPTREPVTRTFPTSQRFDVIVRRDDAEVWRWSADRFFAQVLTEHTFPPGDTLSWTVDWDLRGADGNRVPPGRYEAVGVLTDREEIVTPPVTFRIVE